MLGMKTYPKTYIDACRAKIATDVAAYKAAVPRESVASAGGQPFETAFFNNMVLLLDYAFVHRLRTLEGKDGNPLNEVRVLSDSLLQHGGILTADKGIRLVPSKSVLHYEFGQAINVSEADFERLSAAFFSEIENRYLEKVGVL